MKKKKKKRKEKGWVGGQPNISVFILIPLTDCKIPELGKKKKKKPSPMTKK